MFLFSTKSGCQLLRVWNKSANIFWVTWHVVTFTFLNPNKKCDLHNSHKIWFRKDISELWWCPSKLTEILVLKFFSIQKISSFWHWSVLIELNFVKIWNSIVLEIILSDTRYTVHMRTGGVTLINSL